MPEIAAIRALRYNLGHVGSLSDVVAPATDCISPELQDILYKRHPANAVRLIANRVEPGDAPGDRFERASRFWRRWQAEGVLQHEAAAEIYIYHQQFIRGGQTVTRRGLLCGVRIHSPSDRPLYRHAATNAAAVSDHFELMRRCRANLSPIIGLYSDPTGRAESLLDDSIQEGLGISCVDAANVKHTIWPVDDEKTISRIEQIVGPAPMLIADGHNRLQAASDYLNWLRENEGPISNDHPANFVLSMLLCLEESAELLQPTHRVFRGTEAITSEDLIVRLGECFTCNIIHQSPDAASLAWTRIASRDAQGQIAIYCPGDDHWVVCDATDAAVQRLRELFPESSDQWCELSLNLLHRLVVTDLLDASGASIEYARGVDHVVAAIERTIDCSFAAMLPPAELESIETIAVQDELLPSASFHVKPDVLTGLVFV